MNIAEELKSHVVPIDDLKKHPENPHKGSVEDIAASLRRFGQVRPLVALPDGTIVAGNHTWEAAKQLGAEQIAAIMVPLSGDDAMAYLIADNRTSEKSSWDDHALVEILQSLSDEGHLDGTGYTVDEVDDLLAYLGRIEETEKEEFKGGYGEDPEETAARAARGEEAVQGASLSAARESVLLYSPEDHERFGQYASELKKRWEVDKISEVALLALQACVEHGLAKPE